MSRNPGHLDVDMIGPLPKAWGGGGRWPGGGVSSHMRGLLPALGAEDVNVHLLAENSSAARATRFPQLPNLEIDYMERSPLKVARLLCRRGGQLAQRMAFDPILRQVPLGQRLRFLAQTANFDRFLTENRGRLLHIQRAYHRQYLCQNVCGLKKPLIVTVHSVNLLVEPHPTWVEQMIVANYQRADRLIAVSNFVKAKMVSYGADPEQIRVIHNGVDTTTFAPAPKAGARQELGLSQESFLLLFSGNLIRRKGVDVLLHAFARVANNHPSAHLVILGNGPEQATLCELAQQLAISRNVSFVGRQPFTNMPTWYQAADLFVMPSSAEGLSMSILEAMATGRPVVTTRPDTGVHDAIVPGITGLLVNYGAAAELARALQQLVEQAARAREMGAAGRRRAEALFGWDQIAKATVEIYRELLRKTASEAVQ